MAGAPRGLPASDGDRLDDLLIALLHHRWPPAPDITDPYPSELHIDLLPQAQGHGWGRRLIDRVLDSFRAAGSPAVHLGTATDNRRAIAFYRHLGFRQLTDPGEHDTTIVFGMDLDPDARGAPT